MGQLSEAIKILDALRSTSSRNEKLDLLTSHADNKYLKRCFELTTNPLITFGIKIDAKKKFRKVKAQLKPQSAWNALESLLDSLSKRELTGKAAEEACSKLLAQLPKSFQIWAIRIINRNLDCGVKEGTYTRVWEDMENGWGVPLAEKAYDKNGNILEDLITFPCYGEPKFDGFNISSPHPGKKYKLKFLLKGQKFYALSRGQIHYPILDPLVKILYKHIPKDKFVCGEAYAIWRPGDEDKYTSPWGKAATMLRSGMTPTGFQPDKVSKEVRELFKRDFQLWLFEYASNSFYMEEHGYEDPTPKRKRRALTKKLVKAIDSKYIKLSPCVTLRNMRELKAYYKECLDKGFEGIMIKDMDAPLKNERNTYMLKLKPDKVIDGIIVRVKRGNGKNNKWAGALDVYITKYKKVVSCNVRTDKQRKEFWETKKDMVGVQCEVRIQKEPKGREVSVSRFIRLDRVRFDLRRIAPVKVAKMVGKSTLNS